jgi:hypothetical protein
MVGQYLKKAEIYLLLQCVRKTILFRHLNQTEGSGDPGGGGGSRERTKRGAPSSRAKWWLELSYPSRGFAGGGGGYSPGCVCGYRLCTEKEKKNISGSLLPCRVGADASLFAFEHQPTLSVQRHDWFVSLHVAGGCCCRDQATWLPLGDAFWPSVTGRCARRQRNQNWTRGLRRRMNAMEEMAELIMLGRSSSVHLVQAPDSIRWRWTECGTFKDRFALSIPKQVGELMQKGNINFSHGCWCNAKFLWSFFFSVNSYGLLQCTILPYITVWKRLVCNKKRPILKDLAVEINLILVIFSSSMGSIRR